MKGSANDLAPLFLVDGGIDHIYSALNSSFESNSVCSSVLHSAMMAYLHIEGEVIYGLDEACIDTRWLLTKSTPAAMS